MTEMTHRGPLQANETRTATQSNGWKVKMEWIAGGSFCKVEVRDTIGRLAFTHAYMFESEARQTFDGLAKL
jgi:hypothetical protein